jgi:hypothetical protein
MQFFSGRFGARFFCCSVACGWVVRRRQPLHSRNHALELEPAPLVVRRLRACRYVSDRRLANTLKVLNFGHWHGSCEGLRALVETTTRENDVNYKKYEVHSPLFALRDPRLSEQVLAAFSGAARRPLLPPPPAPRRKPEGRR